VVGLSVKAADGAPPPRTALDVGDLVAWLQETDRRRAERVLEVACGFAVLDDTYSSAHSLNKMVVTSVCTAQDLVDVANRTLGHLGQRLVEVHDLALAGALAPGLASRGWTRSDDLVMTSTRPGQPSPTVVELALPERQRVAAADWQRDEPQQDPEVWHQLGDRVQTFQLAAAATYLAVPPRRSRRSLPILATEGRATRAPWSATPCTWRGVMVLRSSSCSPTPTTGHSSSTGG